MFLPYKVDVPMQRWPIANWVLMGLTILISFAMFGPLDEWNRQRRPMANVPPEWQQMMRDAGLVPTMPEPSIVDSFLLQPANFRVTQLVGNLFIHAGFFHLAGNMLFLFVFGNAVNAKLGHLKFVLVYLGAGILESCVWLVLGPRMPCLGASGAIMGIVGAFLVLYPLNDVSIAYMFTMFYRGVFELSAMWVIAVYFAFDVWGLVRGGNSGVAYLSHVVGFLTGASAAAALLWFKVTEMDRQERSLLQVWRLMPHEEDEKEEEKPRLGGVPEYLLRQQLRGETKMGAAAARPSGGGAVMPGSGPARVVKKRDEGPIPMD